MKLKIFLLALLSIFVFISCESKEEGWYKNVSYKFYTNGNESLLFVGDKVLVGDEETVINPLASIITLLTTSASEIKSKNEAVYTMDFFVSKSYLNFKLNGNTLNCSINGEEENYYYNDELTKKYYTNIMEVKKWWEEYSSTNE
ncbi:hypothetical protein [Brachyspira alvinipulli]|uniref:hypothetical protein n=1 Tax=Brachyspira alvinipulli TaxID=84379 RepID=UPI0004807DD7|nr:hypothetical protein [Brachyspira alvinipulli]